MRIPASCSILLCALALSSACKASKGEPSVAPMDAYYEAPAAEAMADVGAEQAVPGSAPIAAGGSSTGAVLPSAVMGSLPPTGATAIAGGTGDKAIADAELPTAGDDAVDQMLVFNGSLGLAVKPDTIPAAIDAAVELAVAAGGYIAQQTDTTLTLRVPSRRFRKLMKGIEGLGQVRARSVQTLDVSEEFHDLKVRLENLQSTRTRIQKLLGQAKDLNEILVVEKELERVSAEIDRIEGRLRFLSSQAAFSTVTVAFSELPRETVIVAEDAEPPPPPLPAPARTLGPSAGWLEDVDVHHLISR